MLPWLGNYNSLVNCCLRGVGTSLCALWPEAVNPWRQELCLSAVSKFQSLEFYLINEHLAAAYSTGNWNAWCVANHHANFNEPRSSITLLCVLPQGTYHYTKFENNPITSLFMSHFTRAWSPSLIADIAWVRFLIDRNPPEDWLRWQI